MSGISHKPCNMTTGTYVGDSSANKAISHGLGRIPLFVEIFNFDVAGFGHKVILSEYSGFIIHAGLAGSLAVTPLDAYSFYVGNAADYGLSSNVAANTYYWIAVG